MEKDPSVIIENLAQELADLRIDAIKRDGWEAQNRIVAVANKLKLKYSDYEEYAMFHILIGSTPDEGKQFTKFDFPEEDSIASFIRSL
ncbi:MAG: hypothetical protein Q7T50_02555 [Candidatus Magasanikbacteria bacterium]|nr:hypothetical protein [Candidatus Magasanikbacteria bacterium]